MDKRVILAMDGATNASTAALLAAGAGPATGAESDCAAAAWRVVARRVDLDGRGHARLLLRLADEMLRETGRAPEDIAAIVAGVGPGTFTGVRIAVATARGLALALEVPILGSSTLSALAAEALELEESSGKAAPDEIVPVVDARRGQLFYARYRRVGDRFVRTEPFAVCDREALLTAVAPGTGRTLIAGDVGNPEAIAEREGVFVLPLQIQAEHLLMGQHRLLEPGAGVEGARLDGWLMGAISGSDPWCARGGKAGEPGSPEAVKPVYVRAPDADIHITKMRDPWAGTAGER